MTLGAGSDCGVESLLLHNLAMSFFRSLIAESLRDFVDAWLLIPLSTELSRRLRSLSRWLGSVVVCLDQGKDFAMSASVSRRQSLFARVLFAEAPPLHSLRMSVSWAKLDRRRRVFVGDDS